jgi:hypothetical protein
VVHEGVAGTSQITTAPQRQKSYLVDLFLSSRISSTEAPRADDKNLCSFSGKHAGCVLKGYGKEGGKGAMWG